MAIKAVVAQAGGPTQVVNATLVGLITESRRRGIQLFGSYHGIEGLIGPEKRLLDTDTLSEAQLSLISHSPGAALGSIRERKYNGELTAACEFLVKNGIHYFFYLGGNGAAGALLEMSQLCPGIHFVHVPKTIDNDLCESDHTPGYGSAGLFVANAVRGIIMENMALPGINIVVIMGRNSGFLTAAASLATLEGIPESGPHMICLPETLFDENMFLTQVNAVYARLGRVVIAVGEGISTLIDGKRVELAAELLSVRRTFSDDEKRDGGNGLHNQLAGHGLLADHLASLIKRRLGVNRVRGDTFGYLQRCFPLIVSQQDHSEAKLLGQASVNKALDAGSSGAITLNATRYPYNYSFGFCDLSRVAGQTRTMPKSFIGEDGFGVTEGFSEYVAPLIGQLPQVGTLLYPL